ncbi:ral guanine nucleotide dissociation stimulator-like [Tamandua tetradactyla]|uniref:ral guanine nucleotide dissociation stimulator-like n=1 Tax=Tamandua tetradactyla TaxID=48850 RepID=UPI004053FF39
MSSRSWWQVLRTRDPASPRQGSCTVQRAKAGPQETLAGCLAPAFQEGHPMNVTIFLGTFRVFTATQRVLDLLFQRYGPKLRSSDGHGEWHKIQKVSSLCSGQRKAQVYLFPLELIFQWEHPWRAAWKERPVSHSVTHLPPAPTTILRM